MKQILFRFLYSMSRISGWRWLAFASGFILLGSSQSCNTGKIMCYEPMPVDTTTINEPRCYDRATPVDSVKMEEHDDNGRNN